jgi:multiple sugar transport system ATP-binding protein
MNAHGVVSILSSVGPPPCPCKHGQATLRAVPQFRGVHANSGVEMAELEFRNISKKFGDVYALKDLNLTVADKSFVVLVGPSGCGKSTALMLVAGLEEVTAGEILIDGRMVNHVEPKDRDIAMVFQNYALYPHMNVFKNMAFGLKLRGFPKTEIRARVQEAAGILEIESLLDRKPNELSGGQRQRVAMGRAIVRQPKVFLFDEPLSNLDAKLRMQMRAEISKLHERLRTTVLYVTHDHVEAMTLAERIVIMKDGRIMDEEREFSLAPRYRRALDALHRQIRDSLLAIFFLLF